MQGCYLYQQKGRKVGDIGGDLLMLGIVGVAGYLVYKNFLGGGTGTSSNNTAIDQNTASTVANDQAAAAAQGIVQSISDSTLSTLANTLYYEMGNGAAPSDVVNNVSSVNNYADWLRLVQLYGTKKFDTGTSAFSSCSLLGLGCDSLDLGTTLKTFLPAAYLSNLNSYFSDQGIPVTL